MDWSSSYATLVWRKSKVILLDDEATEDFDDEFGASWRNVVGWKVFSVGACAAAEVLREIADGE